MNSSTIKTFVQKWGVRLSQIKAWIGYLLGVTLVGAGMYFVYQQISAKYVARRAVVNRVFVETHQRPMIESSYRVRGTMYRKMTYNEFKLQPGDWFTVYVNPDHPNDVTTQPPSIWFATSVILLGVCIMIMSWFSVWLSKKTGGITGWL